MLIILTHPFFPGDERVSIEHLPSVGNFLTDEERNFDNQTKLQNMKDDRQPNLCAINQSLNNSSESTPSKSVCSTPKIIPHSPIPGNILKMSSTFNGIPETPSR